MIHLFCFRRSWRINLLKMQVYQSSSYFLSTVPVDKHLNAHGTTGSSLEPSFLQESCGLSLEASRSVCKKIQMTTTEKAQTIINLFREKKFTKAQVAKVISARPKLLLTDPDEILKPNFKTFESLGLTGENLVKTVMKSPTLLQSKAEVMVQFLRRYGFSSKMILRLTMRVPKVYSMDVNKTLQPKVDFLFSLGFIDVEVQQFLELNPYVLLSSIENSLIPFLRKLRLVFGDDANAMNVLKRWKFGCRLDFLKKFESNILILENHGVPYPVILKVFSYHPNSLVVSESRLELVIKYIKTLDLDPTSFRFAQLISYRALMSGAKWEQKVETYKTFGLKEEEVNSAIRKQPACMTASVERIKERMDFFVTTLQIKPQIFVMYPTVVLFSMEKRILPRCSTMQLLGSKKLIKSFNLGVILSQSESVFFEQIVKKYEKAVPEIVKAHQGEIDFHGFDKGCWQDLKYCFDNEFVTG